MLQKIRLIRSIKFCIVLICVTVSGFLYTGCSSSDTAAGRQHADAHSPLPGFKTIQFFDEQQLVLNLGRGVTATINAPSAEAFDPSAKVMLILFPLPNGNTTDQTIGGKMYQDDDFHFDIQHIGAQTRFLRSVIKDANIVTAYLENTEKSWPAWRKKYPDHPQLISDIIDSVRLVFEKFDTGIALNGHSGGGSFIFGYLNGKERIPGFIERIGFLDSDYAYDDSLKHGEKIAEWLSSSPDKHLCVLAYNDSIALYNGKPVVSATGGTWYRSKLMKNRLADFFKFNTEFRENCTLYQAVSGRVKFFFLENPERKILHTRQVELNGFIESILSGTPLEESGYKYYGSRAYNDYIQDK
ncbi:MAG: hypothetical protein ACM3Q2_15820 [Syntrophothermus sp.]